MLSLIFTLASEIGAPIADEEKIFQRRLMHSILAAPNGEAWDCARSRLIQNREDADDECAWRGVICHKGIIRTFITSSELTAVLPLRMRMLPSTLYHIHFCAVNLDSAWTAETLPRELRYLFITSSDIVSIDLRKLPVHMEELHSMQNIQGVIDLTELPKEMRLLQLWGVLISTVIVDNAAIPKSIERVRIVETGAQMVDYLLVDGLQFDPRIERGRYVQHLGDSHHWSDFEKIRGFAVDEWRNMPGDEIDRRR